MTSDHPTTTDPLATVDASTLSAAGAPLTDVIGTGPRYTRSSLHAAGGMGNVWLARDTHLGRDVALKELPPESFKGLAPVRFVREARITGQLEHPGIVPVYELGRDPETGRPFYVMRFVRGRTLSQVVELFHRGRRPDWYEPMELVTLLSAFVSVCNTVAYAHSRGVVHRDLKGENIVLGDFGEVIVLDWGLAKRVDRNDPEFVEPEAGLSDWAAQTMVGQVIGTPAYMAPEQAEGRLDQIGACTDIFGLGAILYEILSGVPPFSGADTREVLDRAKRGEIRRPREFWPDVPTGLEAACLKALARAPEDRFQSAIELGQEVQSWQDRQRRRAEEELRQAGDRLRQQQAALVSLTRSSILAGPDLGASFRQLVEVAARTIHVDRVSIWRFTADRRAIRCDSLYELSANRHTSGAELQASAYPSYFDALAQTDVIAADDAQRDPRTCEFADSYLQPLGIGAMMEVPVPPDAVLCHEHVGPPRTWLPDEQLFAIGVGQLAALAISQWERRQAQDGRE